MTDAAQKEPSAEEEIGVLFPDVDVTVRDPDTGEAVTLTVREFRFREGLEVQAEARPLIEALAGLVAGDGTDIAAVDIDEILGGEADLWLALIGRATGRDPEWLARLDDRGAQDLTDAMWSVHAPFFCRRAVRAALAGRNLASLFLSAGSSMRSSQPGTEAETGTEESQTGSPSGKSASSGGPPKPAAPKS